MTKTVTIRITAEPREAAAIERSLARFILRETPARLMLFYDDASEYPKGYDLSAFGALAGFEFASRERRLVAEFPDSYGGEVQK